MFKLWSLELSNKYFDLYFETRFKTFYYNKVYNHISMSMPFKKDSIGI